MLIERDLHPTVPWELQALHHRSANTVPSKRIALILPNKGTSMGLPWSAELSPALSKFWTKLSEYCQALETRKTRRNVAITSSLMLLERQGHWCSWMLLWKSCQSTVDCLRRPSGSDLPIGNNITINIVMGYWWGDEDVFDLKKRTGREDNWHTVNSVRWWSRRHLNGT